MISYYGDIRVGDNE